MRFVNEIRAFSQQTMMKPDLGSQKESEKRVISGNQSLIVVDPEKIPQKNRIPPSAIPPMLDDQLIDALENLSSTAVDSVKSESEGRTDINPKYIVDEKTYLKYESQLIKLVQGMESFDIPAFLTGLKKAPKARANNRLMEKTVSNVKKMANEISKKEEISLMEAYQKLIGLMDTFDERPKDKKPTSLSSFPVRSAILLASHRSGEGLQSWEVYTKHGKPKDNIWPFVENWKNWVPEAQGAMAKFMEASIVDARELAKAHPENAIFLFKGGFGSGKTRQANQVFGEQACGVMAPDKGKQVVRRSLPEVPHAAVHIQGSQLAYGLFEEISELPGTAVYDSSLSNPNDIKHYMEKAEKAGKKVIIYDVTRKDIARMLAVLKRDVEGEDPRIPPFFIIQGTQKDRLNRVDCMRLVLDQTPASAKTTHEYHFIAGDHEGWNSKKVAILKPGNIELLEEADKRFRLEGISINPHQSTLRSTAGESKLSKFFNRCFETKVEDLMNEVSNEERSSLDQVFSKRVISFNTSNLSELNENNFYSYLEGKWHQSLSENDFNIALSSVSQKTRKEFIDFIKRKVKRGEKVTYMDFPLKVALAVHESLKIDPWK